MTDVPDKWNMKFLYTAQAFACAHLFLLGSVFVATFAAGMRRFDQGGDAGFLERAGSMAVPVLAFPLIYVRILVRMPVILELALVVVNSGLWGLGAACVYWKVSAPKRPVSTTEP